jgi:hypothetical protein
MSTYRPETRVNEREADLFALLAQLTIELEHGQERPDLLTVSFPWARIGVHVENALRLRGDFKTLFARVHDQRFAGARSLPEITVWRAMAVAIALNMVRAERPALHVVEVDSAIGGNVDSALEDHKRIAYNGGSA